MKNDNSNYPRLKALENSSFEVSHNESDIRGWIVKNIDGRILGKVNDLLFEKDSEKVLYMVLDLEGNELHLKERKVMLPLEFADLQEAYRNVIYPCSMAMELTELPTYEKGKLTENTEMLVRRAFYKTRNHLNQEIEPIKQSENIERSSYKAGDPGTQGIDTRPRPQTVVGVFEHTNDAQIAIENLLSEKFKRNQIDISSRELDEQFGYPDDDTSLTNWFKSVFGNDEDAKTYSNAAKSGCVVTVHTGSMADAEKAAIVMDNSGAVTVDDSKSKFHSRILDRKDASLRWNRNEE